MRHALVSGASTECAAVSCTLENVEPRADIRTVNKVLLTGLLTRDPDMRSLAIGKNVTTLSDAVLTTPSALRDV